MESLVAEVGEGGPHWAPTGVSQETDTPPGLCPQPCTAHWSTLPFSHLVASGSPSHVSSSVGPAPLRLPPTTLHNPSLCPCPCSDPPGHPGHHPWHWPPMAPSPLSHHVCASSVLIFWHTPVPALSSGHLPLASPSDHLGHHCPLSLPPGHLQLSPSQPLTQSGPGSPMLLGFATAPTPLCPSVLPGCGP